MPTTTLKTIPKPMDAAEAKAAVHSIFKAVDTLGTNLLDLHDREGWRVLGYASTWACLEAEAVKRKRSTVQLLRVLNAALAARNLGEHGLLPMGEFDEIPERVMRPLTHLDPEEQAEAWKDAREDAQGQRPTARQVGAAVERLEGGADDRQGNLQRTREEEAEVKEQAQARRAVEAEVDEDARMAKALKHGRAQLRALKRLGVAVLASDRHRHALAALRADWDACGVILKKAARKAGKS